MSDDSKIDKIQNLIDAGKSLENEGLMGEAYDKYETALKIDKESVPAFVAMGEYFTNLGYDTMAYKYFYRGAALCVFSNTDLYSDLNNRSMRGQNIELVLRNSQKYLDLKTDDGNARAVGILHLGFDLHDDAPIEISNALAELYLEFGEYDRAGKALETSYDFLDGHNSPEMQVTVDHISTRISNASRSPDVALGSLNL